MSTLGAVLNSALKSMVASQAALGVASNNIANASNPDFTRQRLNLAPAVPDLASFGIGTGVEIVGVEALRDSLIEMRLSHELSAKAGADTLSSRIGYIEAQFNDPEGTGLLQKINDFLNSFQTLSQDPASVNFREQVRIAANALIEAFHTRSQDLMSTKLTADSAITTDLAAVNRLTTQIADLTKQIKIEEVTMPANNLRDRRGALVKELSQYVQVNEVDSGDYQVTTKDNRLLVFNEIAKPLGTDVTPAVGGSLGAELEVRDNYIPKYAAALDQVAYEIAQQVNTLHSAGYDLDGNTGINFFAPMATATGAAQLLGLSADVAGDVRKVAASNQPAGNDNAAAIAIGDLLHATVFSGGSITDQYGSLVFDMGSDSASAQTTLGEHEALVTQLQNRRQSVSGVSIDEEAAQIMQFQRAFQASARLLQTVDDLFKVLLGA